MTIVCRHSSRRSFIVACVLSSSLRSLTKIAVLHCVSSLDDARSSSLVATRHALDARSSSHARCHRLMRRGPRFFLSGRVVCSTIVSLAVDRFVWQHRFVILLRCALVVRTIDGLCSSWHARWYSTASDDPWSFPCSVCVFCCCVVRVFWVVWLFK